MNTLWRKQDGWKCSDTVPTDETSFLVNAPLDYDIPTTTVKRGGFIQPQATGQQNRSNIGSGAASSSAGQGSAPQTQDKATFASPKDALGRKVRLRRYLRRRLLVSPPRQNQRRDLPDVAMVTAREPRMYLSRNRPRVIIRTLPRQKVPPLPRQLDRRQPTPRRRLPESESQNMWTLEFVIERNEKSANVKKQLRVIKEPLRLKHYYVQEHPLPAHGQRGRRAVEAQVEEVCLEEVTYRRPLKMSKPALGDVLLHLTLLIGRLPMLMWGALGLHMPKLMWGALIRVLSIDGALRRNCHWRVCWLLRQVRLSLSQTPWLHFQYSHH
jgi:hypothetical protein